MVDTHVDDMHTIYIHTELTYKHSLHTNKVDITHCLHTNMVDIL